MKKISILLSILLFPIILFAQRGSIIVISIDALHPDAVKIVKPENIGKVMNKGVYTLRGRSVSLPKTLISHTAMVTGKLPEDSGYNFNVWKKGDPTVSGETIFHDAKRAGYKTYFIYSKQKLAFLENKAIDRSIFGKDDSISIAEKIISEEKDPFFIFLHISGLDEVGPKYGWLSKEYLEEFKLIDTDLKNIIDYFIKLNRGTIIITSDHSGHDKEHGTDHPEDYKLPFIVYSKIANYSDLQDGSYMSYQLRSILNRAFEIMLCMKSKK